MLACLPAGSFACSLARLLAHLLLACPFACLPACSFACLLARLLAHLLLACPFACSFAHLLLACPFACSFACSFACLLPRLLAHLLACLLPRLLARLLPRLIACLWGGSLFWAYNCMYIPSTRSNQCQDPIIFCFFTSPADQISMTPILLSSFATEHVTQPSGCLC